MAYQHSVDTRRRAVSVGTVTAIHLALGAAFVLGLAPDLIGTDDGGGITTRFVPPPKEAPPPEPVPADTPATTLRLSAPIPKLVLPTTDRPNALPSTDTPAPLPQTRAGPPDWVPAPPPPLPPVPAPTPVPVAKAVPVTPPRLRSIGFGNESYPEAARRKGEEGVTRVTLTIGMGGRATVCEVTGSSGSFSLDEAACRLVSSNSRFTPARDGTGKAVARTLVLPITWVLPN